MGKPGRMFAVLFAAREVTSRKKSHVCPEARHRTRTGQPREKVVMSEVTPLDSTGLEVAYYRLYRDFFDMAEKRRRWNLREDIPWDQVNPSLNPAIADIVESFCAVELYLPDYMAKNLPRMRDKRG